MTVAALTPKAVPANSIFAAASDRLPGGADVSAIRQSAFDAFNGRGLPTRRVEEWKYTDLRALMGAVAPLAPTPDQTALATAASVVAGRPIGNAVTLVMVDGAYAGSLTGTVPAGLRVVPLREALTRSAADLLSNPADDPMLALNAAMATDGVVVQLDDGVALTQPLHLLHVATRTGTAAYTRSRITIGRQASLTLVESYLAAAGAATYQTSDLLSVEIGDGASLQHVRLMEDARDAINIAGASFTLGAAAKLNTFSLTVGASVSRYQPYVTFAGEGAELATNGVALLGGTRHGDVTLLVDHAVPNCSSRENFRTVLDGRGHAVFQGRIVVRQVAQKTDGKMMTRALLLSDDAEIDNKPELEIFADDVTCGHGATAGALDQSLLFYLRARGLPEPEAQALLVEAFVGEAIESIVDDDLRDLAVSSAQRWLKERD